MGIPNSTIQKAKPLIFCPGKFLKNSLYKKIRKNRKATGLKLCNFKPFQPNVLETLGFVFRG